MVTSVVNMKSRQTAIQEIEEFFTTPQQSYFKEEDGGLMFLTVCLKRPDLAFGTAIIEYICGRCTSKIISDTVLYKIIRKYKDEEYITVQTVKCEGRGRPRNYFLIRPDRLKEVEKLVKDLEVKVFDTNISLEDLVLITT